MNVGQFLFGSMMITVGIVLFVYRGRVYSKLDKAAAEFVQIATRMHEEVSSAACLNCLHLQVEEPKASQNSAGL